MKIRKKIKISGMIKSKYFDSQVEELAKKFNLSGWIKDNYNSTSIEIEGDNVSVFNFIEKFKYKPKGLSKIIEFDLVDVPALNNQEDFYVKNRQIYHSAIEKFTHDSSICNDCLKEIVDPYSEKYFYPFIACDKCGPKYSILEKLPYTRENSSLKEFPLCEKCKDKIAQGNLNPNFSNCADCGPQIELLLKKITCSDRVKCFEIAGKLLQRNGVVILKNTNCFYITCSAFSKTAVDRIRKIKNRESKPLSLMACNIKEIKKFAMVSLDEEKLLKSKERPIVFLTLKNHHSIAQNVINGYHKIGVMLPSSPIQHLLFVKSKYKVLVMSSASTSGSSIEVDNDRIIDKYKGKVDGILLHNLKILNGADDSMLTVVNGQKYFYRVGRGYAPLEIPLDVTNSPSILACGAHRNSTVSIVTSDNKIKISPYMGNLDNSATFGLYKKNLMLFSRLFNFSPEYTICDLNLDYFSSKYAKSLDIQNFQVQHSYAHLLSCLADNEISLRSPAIGVIFDGKGYGKDQTIWGGEFLVSKNLNFKRAFSLPVIKLPGMKDKEQQIYRIGYSLLKNAQIVENSKAFKNLEISEQEIKSLNLLMDSGLNSPITTSVNMLFEGVASILGLLKQTSYEEQAVLGLEALADKLCNESYKLSDYNIKNINELIVNIVKDIDNKKNNSKIIAKFHNTLADMVAATCLSISKTENINNVVLSGSVWMNILLLEKTMIALKNVELNPIIHKNISPNDEGLSVGQSAYLAYKLDEKTSQVNDQNIDSFQRLT